MSISTNRDPLASNANWTSGTPAGVCWLSWARQYTFVTLLLEWDGNATIVKPLDMMKMPSELRRVHHLR